MSKYVLGLDFGTLSCRGVLVDVETGRVITQEVVDFEHGVIDEELPCYGKLPANFALQVPQDYIRAMRGVIDKILQSTGMDKSLIGGLGIDFTACTWMSVDENGTPLCELPEFVGNPHAYVKLWKHHAAQPQADQINALATQRKEPWLSMYGGKISCEWALPKTLETLHHAPKVYEKAARFMEAADWLSLKLTGTETRSAPFAGYKGLWNDATGYPSNDFLCALDPRLDGMIGTKIPSQVLGMDNIAGYLSEQGAQLCGLHPGTPLALPMIDAHAAMPALNITADGELMLILGTSACHIVNDKHGKIVEGICGYVKDGVIPGYYTYEAGQAAVGDIFDWYVKNCLPAAYAREAEAQNINVHTLLERKAADIDISKSELVALDWWNGNRNILNDASLTGMISGFTLRTKPEEIYRALIEATAFGLRVIVEQYERFGVAIRSVCAAGGISQKNDLLMQIYADVLNRDIRIAGSGQAAALGSAIYAAVAAGYYPNVKDAATHMAPADIKKFTPIADHVQAYDRLYSKYKRLHDTFGRQ
jgi:L-ribulokinase